jgi:hypothetical protein
MAFIVEVAPNIWSDPLLIPVLETPVLVVVPNKPPFMIRPQPMIAPVERVIRKQHTFSVTQTWTQILPQGVIEEVVRIKGSFEVGISNGKTIFSTIPTPHVYFFTTNFSNLQRSSLKPNGHFLKPSTVPSQTTSSIPQKM